MTSKTFFITSLFFLLIFTCCCEKDEEQIIMPDETSVGAHTFGCYVNNDLFVHPKRKAVGQYWYPSLDAHYYVKDSLLKIISYDFYNRSIVIADTLIEVGKTHRVISATYTDENNNAFTTNDDLFAEIHLTKLDTIHLIVSGTFSFKAKHDKSDSIVNVTNGRFDIELFDLFNKE
jgi:hypothetical protein